MLPELVLTENEELGYYITFDKLFPDFVPYFQNFKKGQLIEVNFSSTDEDIQPSEAQLAAHEFLLTHSNQMLENLVRYLKQDEEYFLEFYGVYTETSYENIGYKGRKFTSRNRFGFPIVTDIHEFINYFGIGSVNISDTEEDGISCIGFSGSCTWDEEHGFGAAFYKLKLLDVDDWNVGNYLNWSHDEDSKDLLTNKFTIFHKLEPLEERKKRLANLSEKNQVENPEDYEEIFDWLIRYKMIYGYRNNHVDLNAREKAVVLNEIKELSFYGNEIETIPSSIHLLKKLTSLLFSFNKLVAIPVEICKLTTLKSLTISNNQLERIPKQIGMLENLESLILSRNKLQFVTGKIERLTKLKHLDVSSNHLTELPKSILGLTSLEKLFVQNNSFTSFPEIIIKMKSLKTLNIATNKLVTIPESIDQCQSLEQLDLRSNELTILPDSIFTKMPNLKWLQVNINKFSIADLERFQLLVSSEMKTDLDSTIAVTKDEIKRKQIKIENERRQQEKEKSSKQPQQKISAPKAIKKDNKKWWEFWRK
ncbi:MAG: leucine-rich repeat domain-containing protein [Kordia sp.]|uniref:leucine-rich repeat domain-containing protein n=1 Tax=Kordia sp. TaxID=1965332 RepID=UPI00385B527D